jgi:uncharacterized membrane protein
MHNPAGEPVLLDAILRPSPPLSTRVLARIVMLVAAVNLVFGLGFILKGAWLVTPFMGVDVVLLAWAFHASLRASQRTERVVLTPSRLVVLHQGPNGVPREIQFNPYWVRVELSEPPERGSPLLLRSHGRALQLGTFLGPEERLSLADTLRSALRRARETIPP